MSILMLNYIFSGILLLFIPYLSFIISLTVLYDKVRNFIIMLLNKYSSIYNYFLCKTSLLYQVVGKNILRNILDQPFIPWIIHLFIVIPIIFLSSFYIQTYYSLSLIQKLLCMLIYHILLMGPKFRNFALCAVLYHRACHTINGIFKNKYLNIIFEWSICNLYGFCPEQYTMCHVKDHHKYSGKDIISVIQFDRTSILDFLVYLSIFGFGWTGIPHIINFLYNKNYIFAFRTLLGSIIYFSFFYILYRLNPFFALTHYILIFIFNILFHAAINWTWHGFCDKDQIDNEYINSTTFINGTDNVFNEDYHVAHHLQHMMHWIDLKKHYENNTEIFKQNQATIFTNIQQIELFFYMILKKYDLMANKFVDLSGKLTHEDKIKLLKKRMQKINFK
jgi:fatty acid desaturase